MLLHVSFMCLSCVWPFVMWFMHLNRFKSKCYYCLWICMSYCGREREEKRVLSDFVGESKGKQSLLKKYSFEDRKKRLAISKETSFPAFLLIDFLSPCFSYNCIVDLLIVITFTLAFIITHFWLAFFLSFVSTKNWSANKRK